MTKTRRGGLVVALFTFITILGGTTAPLTGQDATRAVKPTTIRKSRHLSKEDEARQRLMRELYQIAAAPMALRAGRAGLLLDRLMMDDQERRIAELERLRPRPVRRPVPVLIARQGDPIGRQGL